MRSKALIPLLALIMNVVTGLFCRAQEFKLIVSDPVLQDTSKPLRDIKPMRLLKKGPRTLHEVRRLRVLRAKGLAADPVVQNQATKKISLVVNGFEGIGKGLKYEPSVVPPDTTGAVGKDHFIEWVNRAFGIFEKKSHQFVYPADGRPADGNTIWSEFGKPSDSGHECATSNDGDPVVLYDRLQDRWILSQFSYSKGKYLQCIAISVTSDPLGKYSRYAYQFDAFNDYGKFAVWPDGYYATFNMFKNSTPSKGDDQGSRACAFDRANMLEGQPAKMLCFALPQYQGLLPADLEGTTLPSPTTGKGSVGEYFLNIGINKLNAWRFLANWKDVQKTQLLGPTEVDGVKPFLMPCDEKSCESVPQRNSTVLLDSMGDRLMYRLSYRNLGDHEAFLVNHAVQVPTAAKDSIATVAFRWYEIRTSGTNLKVYQSGTYQPDAASRWMASMGMDKAGNLLAAYSVSGSSVYPGVRVTGRCGHDVEGPNQLAAEISIINGSASQSGANWGDYTTMTLDPTDDSTLWFVSQYLTQKDADGWHTFVSYFKFDVCH